MFNGKLDMSMAIFNSYVEFTRGYFQFGMKSGTFHRNIGFHMAIDLLEQWGHYSYGQLSVITGDKHDFIMDSTSYNWAFLITGSHLGP